MSLNIKDSEAHELARQVAEATGESLTRAVVVALRERLERVRHRKQRSLADELMEIGRRCAADIREPATSQDHDELFYDEQGLPR